MDGLAARFRGLLSLPVGNGREFFCLRAGQPGKCFRRRIAQRLLSAFRWSLYLAFAKMRKGNGRTQVFSSIRGEPTPARHSEGDSDAKVPPPFLRIRGRRRIGFRDASDRLPPLASSSAASAGRQTGRSRPRPRPGRTPRSRFRSPSRSPLTARCLDVFFQRAVGVQPTVSFTVCSGGQTCASVSRRRLMSRSGESPKRLL